MEILHQDPSAVESAVQLPEITGKFHDHLLFTLKKRLPKSIK